MIDTAVVKDKAIADLAYRVRIEEDYATTRKERGQQFVGVTVTPVIAGSDVEYCDASLWGVEYGDFLLADEGDKQEMRVSISLDTMLTGYQEGDESNAYPVNELIAEVRQNLATALGSVIDDLRKTLTLC